MAIFQVKHRVSDNKTSRQAFTEKAYVHLKKHPFLFFGLPFISFIVGSSFFLTNFTQTRYDYQSTRIKTVSKEEKLSLDSGRKPLSIQEEYWRLLEHQDKLNDWEPKRVERPEGEE